MAGKSQDDEHFDRIQQQNAAFDQFERQFQEVLLELEGEESLEVFRKEYDTLHASFLRLHDGEKRLVKKCLDLQADIHSCQVKVKTAEDLSAGDQCTIDTLRKEITKAKARLEQSIEKEVTAKENIRRLRLELKDLEKLVEKGVAGLVGHDNALLELGRVRDDLSKERDTQRTQLAAIQSDIQAYQESMAALEKEREKQDEAIRNINDVIQDKYQLLEHERNRKDYWENELKVVKQDLLTHHSQIKSNEKTLEQAHKAIAKLDEQLHEQEAATEKAVKEYDNIHKKTQKYQQGLEQEIEKTGSIKAENQSLQGQIRQKDNEINSLKTEQQRLTKMRDAVNKRNRTLEQQKNEVEHERNALALEVHKTEMDINTGRRDCENDRKQIDDLTRERDILNKNYLKAQGDTGKQKDWLLIKENQRRNLEQEIRGYEKHAHKQRQLIYHLEHETGQYEKEAQEAHAKYQKTMEEVRTLEAKVDESQRAIHDSDNKLKQQQNLFEQVLNERNVYSKQLLELHADIQDSRRKFKIMNHSIQQLKDEITQKDKDLVQHNVQKSKLDAEKKRYQHRGQKYKKLTEAYSRKIVSLANEINKLNEIINEADCEKAKQRRDYENVMNERDILGAQLIKRNDELARLYERIRIQQSAMNKGDVQYRDRMVELQQLNDKSSQLRNELNTVKNFISKIETLKLQINVKNNTLIRESAKVKALTDELQNPLNVHRWHKTEGSDPQTYETLLRIRKLRKQLIIKTEEVQEKEKLIEEKERLYVELKGALSRQPGPEVAEQLNVYKDNLTKKTQQMKAMQVSLNHFRDQVTRLQAQCEDIKGEFGTMHTDYFKKRKTEAKMNSDRQKVAAMMGETAPAGGMGGQATTYTGHKVPPLSQTAPGPSDTDAAAAAPPMPTDIGNAFDYDPARAAQMAAAAGGTMASVDGGESPAGGAETPMAGDGSPTPSAQGAPVMS